MAAEFVDFPNQAKIVDVAIAASYTLAVAENGDVYFWGKDLVCMCCGCTSDVVHVHLWGFHGGLDPVFRQPEYRGGHFIWFTR